MARSFRTDFLPARHDDYHTLLRFLKARELNVEKTIQMWEEMLNWRKEFGTDTIIECKKKEDLEWILDNGPWMIGNSKPLVLQVWKPDDLLLFRGADLDSTGNIKRVLEE
ncbi:hypothetical protein V2J09_017606 [Rumex salicifolius]